VADQDAVADLHRESPLEGAIEIELVGADMAAAIVRLALDRARTRRLVGPQRKAG
jgi:hypothetical protein